MLFAITSRKFTATVFPTNELVGLLVPENAGLARSRRPGLEAAVANPCANAAEVGSPFLLEHPGVLAGL